MKRGLGRISWHELVTGDVDGAAEFYSALLGWDVDAAGDATGRRLVRQDGTRLGAMRRLADDDADGPRWVAFTTVDDVDRTVAAARDAGASVVQPGTDVPGLGRQAVVRDPDGALTGLRSASEHEPPEWDGPVPAGHFNWHELVAVDPRRAQEFHAALHGWKPKPLDAAHPKRVLFEHAAGRSEAAMTALPAGSTEEAKTAWLSYICVEDTVAAMLRALDLRAATWKPPTDTPEGTCCVIADPQGAPFALLAAPRD